jgi:Flp pilus assembly protein TadD
MANFEGMRAELERRKLVLGHRHEGTLWTMQNLGLLYWSTGRLDEARKLQVEVAESRKTTLRHMHPSTLESLSNLAITYWCQGRLERAEKLGLEVLESRKAVLGKDHTDTLGSMTNLAVMYQRQGRLSEAAHLMEEVVGVELKLLGRQHQYTLSSMTNLASIYACEGRREHAEELLGNVAMVREEIEKQEKRESARQALHLATLRSIADLASVTEDTSLHVTDAIMPNLYVSSGPKIDTWKTVARQRWKKSPLSAKLPLPPSDLLIEPTTETDYGSDITRLVKDHYLHDTLGTEKLQVVIKWEIGQFVSDYLGGDKDLADVFTVTGTDVVASGITCRQYVTHQWKAIGPQILDLMPAILDGVSVKSLVGDVRVVLKPSASGCHASFFTTREDTVLSTQDLDTAISVIQILAWLTSVFRIPILGAPHCSALELEQRHGVIGVALGTLKPITDKKCWHDLIPSTTIALGFPVRVIERSGLDIEWEVMLELADVLFQTDLSKISTDQAHIPPTVSQPQDTPAHGIFYSGAGTLLYPIGRFSKSLGGRDVFRWHFDVSGQTAMPPPDSFLPLRNEDDLAGSRHLLGFAPESEVQLGTRDRMHDHARMSSVVGSIERNGPEFSVETITATFGRAPVTATLGGKIKYSQALRATRDPEKRKYDSVLRITERQPVILCDCGSHKAAWLVSQLSVILDLVCFRIQKEGWATLPRHATPQADGGAAAAEVLKDASVYNRALSQTLEGGAEFNVLQLVKEIYCAMQQRRILQELPTHGTLIFHRRPLHSWDLVELADPPDDSLRRAIVVHETTSRAVAQYPSWMPLANHIPVFSGQELGEVMTVADQPIPVQRATHSEKYLMANIHAMRSLLKRKPDCAHYHLDCELVWERPITAESLFVDREQVDQYHEMYFEHLDQYVQTLRKLSEHQCMARPGPAKLYQDGLVIFGPDKSTLLGRFNDWADRIMPSS